MKKSIIIDASHWRAKEPTGVERYTTALLERLPLLLKEKGFQSLFVDYRETPPATLPEGAVWHYLPYQRGWGQRSIPRMLQQKEGELYFTPSGIVPYRSPISTVMTVHDLAIYDVPQAYSFSETIRLRWLLPRAAHQADGLLVPSAYVAQRITQTWHIPSERIAVTPLAFQENSSEEEIVPQIHPDIPLILCVGRVERKKNLIPLIQAFGKVATSHPAQLILAGKPGHGIEEIKKTIAKLPEPVRKLVIQTGYISEAQKNWLMKRAVLWTVPSPYEGFGLPVLEGFQAGIPVVAAAAGSLPEVGGAAAELVKPFDTAGWVEVIKKSLTNPEWSNRRRQAGYERLKAYSWDHTAQLTTEALLRFI